MPNIGETVTVSLGSLRICVNAAFFVGDHLTCPSVTAPYAGTVKRAKTGEIWTLLGPGLAAALLAGAAPAGCAKGVADDGDAGFGGLPAHASDGDDSDEDADAPAQDDADAADADAGGEDDAGTEPEPGGEDGEPGGDDGPMPPPEDPPPGDPPPEDPPGGGAAGDCCEVQATPGCIDAAISTCVCDTDAFCCETEWDAVCVSMVDTEGCGQCAEQPEPPADPPPADPPPVDPPSLDSPCCVPQPGPGCGEDPGLEACVCGADPFCCEVLWDDACLETAHLFCDACC